MGRFIQEEDYAMQIRQEIIRLLTDEDFYSSPKLVRAEKTAIAQIANRIGKRYNLEQVFAVPNPGEEDTRDQFIVTITIDMALYHLYSQTGLRDIPAHRQQRYQDALDWLRDVGNGTTTANLPPITDDNGNIAGDFFFSSRTPENHKW